jgi:hypothetical protein
MIIFNNIMKNINIELNDISPSRRLSALKSIIAEENATGEKPVFNPADANNHIHTIYSFSPYSPTLAAYKAYKARLKTMGIMDHDTLSGAREFISACEILNTASTVGLETRAHFKKGYGRINNPDQEDYVYIAAHGIPHQSIAAFNEYMRPFRDKRNVRNAKMTEKINEKFGRYGITLDFKKDVYDLSTAAGGGTVTERHLLFALAEKIIEKFKNGEKIVDFVSNTLKTELTQKVKNYISDENNPYLTYDLLGALKSDTSFFYINADEESPTLEEYITFAKSMGAIVAYPYLGDVGESVTGDKKAQKFEDDFLEELLSDLKTLGVDAIAFMPTRNTEKQIVRLMSLCDGYGFFQISGEDINSPRQKFECPMLENPLYSHLIKATWALIGHEKSASENIEDGMFTKKTISRIPDLKERIEYFAAIGKSR